MDESPKSSSERTTNLITPDPIFPKAPYVHREEYLAPTLRDSFGMPVGQEHRPWEGIAPRKPWQYRIVAGIAHINQPQMLKCVVETLRLQTERPFIHVVDLGSDGDVCDELHSMECEADDIRIDNIHPRGWSQTSAPVATAMDLIFASCDYGVEFAYSTHIDCFLKSRKYLSWLASKCNAMTPVVGYQMSPRKMTDQWEIIPSHTASLYHLPTMRRIRAQWSMHAAAERLGLSPEAYRFVGGWPDTESGIGFALMDAGIGMRWLDKSGRTDDPKPGEPPSWLCLGPEANERYETPWLIHERSYPSQSLYCPEHAAKRKDQVDKTIAETWARMTRWREGKME